MNTKKSAAAVAVAATMLSTSGCLTAEFWNCCLFGQTPAASTAVPQPHDLPLRGLTRHIVAPTMPY